MLLSEQTECHTWSTARKQQAGSKQQVVVSSRLVISSRLVVSKIFYLFWQLAVGSAWLASFATAFASSQQHPHELRLQKQTAFAARPG